MKYVPLHVHSEYSLLNGLSQTSQISKRLSDIGTEACALTDHGTVSGKGQSVSAYVYGAVPAKSQSVSAYVYAEFLGKGFCF